jgi:hypothetical protein
MRGKIKKNAFPRGRAFGSSAKGMQGLPVRKQNPADARCRFPVAGARGILTATAGTISTTIPFQPNANVPNWAAFQAEFDEFRVLSGTLLIMAVSANTGVVASWVDETDGSNPTATEAQQRPHKISSEDFAAGNSPFCPSSVMHRWKATDYGDLTFSACNGGTPQPAWVKIYTDTANYSGQSAGAVYYEQWYDIEFRGIGGDA